MIEKNAKVLYAHMHQACFLPGINRHIKATLDQESLRGIEMSLGAVGIECIYEGRTFIIPYVNFQSIIIDTSDAKKANVLELKKKNA